MCKYRSIIENPEKLRSMTGLTVEEFHALVPIFALDEGLQPLAQQVERFPDPFLVGDGHAFLLVRSEWRGVRDEQ